ncbi:MAG TPA: ClbS/DfsB family four-helix bundle protein [Anaerolineales bacterium]|nr:ClbS/DfsB family four-helix bundle protein [Anaerolineales bacterium]
MSTKQQLLDELNDEYVRWERLLSRLEEAELVAPQLPAGLSVKDVLAHLWAWQQLSIARLESAQQGRPPHHKMDPDGLDPEAEQNLDRINAWIRESNQHRPWPEVYQDWRRGFQLFIQLARAIPEERLLEQGRYDWLYGQPLAAVLEGSFAHHHEEHYEPLTGWLTEHGLLDPEA